MSRREALDQAVDQVSTLLEARIGLRTEPTVRGRLRRGVRDEAADQGLGLEHYLQTIAARGPVLQRLLNRITIQETSFFRHPEHFEVLARDVLPGLTPPIRIWSVGCANGQEAFSLAMVLEEEGLAGSVIATDLSTDALRRTAAASYHAREMTGLSPARTARHMRRTGTGWEVTESLRGRVTPLRHNLIDAVPDQVRSCQVVFCRNVLIYISHGYARGFLDRVADTVGPAVLFLGSAETIWSVSDRFDTVRMGDTFVYRPRSAAAVHSGLTPAGPARGRPGGIPAATRRTGAGPAVGGSGRAGRTPAARRAVAAPTLRRDDSAAVTRLAREGEQALVAGDHRSAVASFRKWAYLAPDDTLAHLHLGLALEAAGDPAAAGRAFAAARQAMTEADPASVEAATEGYATVELLRLLDAKRQGSGP